MQKHRPEKSEALTAATDRASRGQTQHLTEGFDMNATPAEQNTLLLEGSYEAESLIAAAEREVSGLMKCDGSPEVATAHVLRALLGRLKVINSAVMSVLGDDDLYVRSGALHRDILGAGPVGVH